MKNSFILVLLVLALLFTGANLAFAGEMEWEDVKDNPVSAEQASYPLLRQVMDGSFDEEEGAEQMKTLSGCAAAARRAAGGGSGIVRGGVQPSRPKRSRKPTTTRWSIRFAPTSRSIPMRATRPRTF